MKKINSELLPKNPIEQLRAFALRLENEGSEYLKLSEVIELFALKEALRRSSGFDLIGTINQIELLYEILVDKEVACAVPEPDDFKKKTSKAYQDAEMAAYRDATHREHYDAASDLSTRLSQLHIWLVQTRANNLCYINNEGEIVSIIGCNPDDFISDMSSDFTILHQDTPQGITPIVGHKNSIDEGEQPTVFRRTHYNFKTLMRYEQVIGPEKMGLGLMRINRMDGTYLVEIPIMPEDFETRKLLNAFKNLFEIMQKTNLHPVEREMLIEGLEENGDLVDDVRKELIASVKTGKLPLSGFLRRPRGSYSSLALDGNRL